MMPHELKNYIDNMFGLQTGASVGLCYAEAMADDIIGLLCCIKRPVSEISESFMRVV